MEESKELKIEIWEFKDKIKELFEEIGTGHYGDDIIQTLSLVKNVLKISNKKKDRS